MGIKKVIIYALLRFLSIFLCFTKIDRDKITFVTLTSGELTGDFKLLASELEKTKRYKVRYILIRFEKNLKGDFLYLLNCIKQLFVINTSALVIINDNNYVISNFKRKGVKVLQVWHACGAVKKFGNDIAREYPIRNYDYVLSTSKKWKPVYARAFDVPEERVLPLGMPRTDVLFHENILEQYREKMLQKYPVLHGKYVVLYAPTFRGNIVKGLRYDRLDVKKLIHRLPENYVLLTRMHPLLNDVSLGEHERILNMDHEELNKLLAVTDCFISDYSSIVFDYSVLEKKMVFYVSDLEEYKNEIGLNVEYEMMPGKICRTEEELAEALSERSYDKERVRQFKEEYFTYRDGKSVERITKFVERIMK